MSFAQDLIESIDTTIVQLPEERIKHFYPNLPKYIDNAAFEQTYQTWKKLRRERLDQ